MSAVAPKVPARRRLVRALVIAGSVIAVVAVCSVWVQRQVLDTNEWVSTSDRLLQDHAIQEALANYAVGQFYAHVDVSRELRKQLPSQLREFSGPAASGLRQLAIQGATKLFSTSTFQGIWEGANRVAHQNLVALVEGRSQAIQNQGGTIYLNLRPLVLQVAQQLGVGTGRVHQIPAGVGKLRILRSSQLGLAQDIAAAIRGLALWSSLAVLALFVIAIYLSEGYRWLTVLGEGIGLIVAGIVCLILRVVAGDILVQKLASPNAHAAATAAWSIGSSVLTSVATGAIVYGIAFLIAAWLGSPTRAAQSVRRFLAPLLRDHMPIVAGILGGLAAIWVLYAIGSTQAVLMRLGLVGFGVVGILYLRRHIAVEFPDAELGEFLGPLRARISSLRIPGQLAQAGPGLRERLSRRPNLRRRSAPDEASQVLDQLERLAELRERGILNAKEFRAEKARLLDREDEGPKKDPAT